LKKRPDFFTFLAFEEIRAGGYKGVHKPDAVFPGLAARCFYTVVRFPFVRRYRLNNMEIVFALCGIDIWIAGIFFFRALMVGFQSAGAAFHLGKAHYRVLWYCYHSFLKWTIRGEIAPPGIFTLPTLFCVFATIAITGFFSSICPHPASTVFYFRAAKSHALSRLRGSLPLFLFVPDEILLMACIRFNTPLWFWYPNIESDGNSVATVGC
jgi:hypothetical protein